MTAQAILEKRMAEVEQRKLAERERVAALFEAYSDIKAWALDMKQAFDGQITNFRNAIHGPIKEWPHYQAVVWTKELNGKKGRKG